MPRSKSDPSRDPAYLEGMLRAARAIIGFVQGRTRQDYEGDLLLRSAVERQVELIGEAARLVSQQMRDANPKIPGGPSRPSGTALPTRMARSTTGSSGMMLGRVVWMKE